LAGNLSIEEHVRGATVWIADGPPPNGALHGTGFFVAPGFAVTCAHVLVAAGRTPHLWWAGDGLPVLEDVRAPTDEASAREGKSFPDAAVLRVERTDHPVVSLADPVENHPVWCYGITRIRGGPGGRPEPDGRQLKLTLASADQFLVLQTGRIAGGMSGGPVLDLDQFAVVGLTQSTLDENSEAGGYATPVGAALALWPGDDLRQRNLEVDRESLAALRRDQAGYGRLPEKVQALLTRAGPRLRGHLASEHGLVPPPQPDADTAEWTARQLFRLSLPQLVRALKDTLGDDFKDDAKMVFTFVGPCLPTRNAGGSYWVFGDSADDLRAELETESPRIVHLGTDEPLSAKALLQRALGEPVEVNECGTASGATSTGGAPAQEIEAITSVIAERIGATVEEWSESKEAAEYQRALGTVVGVDLGETPDADRLDALVKAFPGLRIVITKRALTAPPGAEAALHSVAPPLDQSNERYAFRGVRELNTALEGRGIEGFRVRGQV